MSRIHRALGLSEGELAPVLRLSVVHAALGGAIAAGDASVQAVFLARAGAEHLWVVLLSRALVLPLLAMPYAALAGRRSPRAVLGVLAGLAIASSSGAWWLMRGGGALHSIAAYAMHEVVAGLLTVHWGVYLLAGLGGDRALRGVGIVYAAARLGAAMAGFGVVAVASEFGAPSGMGVVIGGLAVVLALHRIEGRGEPHRPPQAESREPLRARWAVARSPLLAAIVIATVVLVCVRFLLRYQQQAVLDAIDERELARILGFYAALANTVSALLSLVVMGRLLPAMKITGANLLYACVLGAAQLALLFAPGVGAALFARFADGELKHALKTPVSSLFYEAFPKEARSAARAIVLGLASPAAQAVGALFLAAVIAGASLGVAGAVGLSAAAIYGASTVLQNRRWRDSVRAGERS